jgi:hypothetical protein
MLFHGNNGYTKAFQCYVLRTLYLLFFFLILRHFLTPVFRYVNIHKLLAPLLIVIKGFVRFRHALPITVMTYFNYLTLIFQVLFISIVFVGTWLSFLAAYYIFFSQPRLHA